MLKIHINDNNILFSSRHKDIISYFLFGDNMIIDDSIERKYEALKFRLFEIEKKYYYFERIEVTYKDYERYYREIIHVANHYDIDYSNITARNGSKKITWEYVQSTDNSYEKFIFAKKAYDRIRITANNIENINLLLDLDHYLGLITNVKNFYFTGLTKGEAIKKSLESRYKRSPTIFKDEIKALAMDYRKFYDINRFSANSIIGIMGENNIRINQEQGLEFVEIGKLICDNKLKEALDKVIEVGVHVKGVPWPE